jgi:hypothetical protein
MTLDEARERLRFHKQDEEFPDLCRYCNSDWPCPTFLILDSEARLREALVQMMAEYKAIADSGDCGNWKAEEQTEYIAARAALGETHD